MRCFIDKTSLSPPYGFSFGDEEDIRRVSLSLYIAYGIIVINHYSVFNTTGYI
jgi:hypothetical protein